MPTLEDKRWTPVRSGPRYCSPACGGNCTHMAYLEAQVEAQQLLDDLGPPTGGGQAWEKRVHENLGWHASVRLIVNNKVYASVHKGTQGYVCYIETNPQFLGSGKSPRAAVKHALDKLVTAQEELTRHRHALVDSLKRLNP